jgi:hypothetical protein
LRPAWINLTWFSASAVAIGYLWWQRAELVVVVDRTVRRRNRAFLFRAFGDWRSLEMSAALGVAGATAVIALLSPPTNFDSMTYQLPRVMHWFQQGTLEHFPTSNLRQIAYAPGSAYWQVQLMAVFGGDIAANIPQWLAFVGAGIALSVWLPRYFDRRAVPLAIMSAVTLPMVLLQATSSQSDLQVGCWTLVAAIFLLGSGSDRLTSSLFAGIAIGLAVLTKTSAFLYVAPMAAVASWRIVVRRGFWRGVGAGLIWVAVSLMICAPHFIRNQLWFGTPLGDDFGTTVESTSPKRVVANMARWALLNVPSVGVWHATAQLLDEVGIDPNDPAITFRDYKFSPPSPYIVYRLLLPDEDFASYTASLLLVAVLVVIRWRRTDLRHGRSRGVTSWWWSIAAMFLLHCILLRWQFWGNRLLLPLALVAFPFVVAWSGAWQLPRLRTAATLFLLLQAMFVLSFSLNRPLMSLPPTWRFTGALPLFSESRTNRFYAGYNAETVPVVQQLIAAVRDRSWKRVGLYFDENYPEYALWRGLHEAGFTGVELHHLNAAPPPSGYRLEWPPVVDGHIRLPVPSTSAEVRR